MEKKTNPNPSLPWRESTFICTANNTTTRNPVERVANWGFRTAIAAFGLKLHHCPVASRLRTTVAAYTPPSAFMPQQAARAGSGNLDLSIGAGF